MTFNDIFKESWLSISGNKVRSMLTVLGIVIGVMAVVIMVAAGETVQKQVTDQFSELGTGTLIIRAGAAQSAGVRSGNRNTLTIQDGEYLANLPDIVAYSPVQMGAAQVIYGNKNWSTSMVGAYPDYATVQSIEMEYGTFFDMDAVDKASTYVVLGSTTAEELGLTGDSIGTVLRIQNTPMTLIGITKEKGDSTSGSQDDMVLMPITTLTKRLSGSRFPDSVSMIILKVSDSGDNTLVTEQITTLLRDRHKLKDTDDDDFQITDMAQVLETMNTVTGYLKMLLIAIAAVSLLVGAIGIMNMMLVSVAERTREIGIRKAIGAREQQIIIQFLSESIFISFIGSMAGLIFGVGLSQGVGRLVLGYEVPFSIWPVVLSISVAVIVGLSSGVMPALKAAKLNPIDSLRYE